MKKRFMKKRIFAVVMTALLMCATFALCVAAEGTAFDVDADVLSPIKTALGEYINIGNIIKVVVAGIGVSLGFVVAWFGFRKVKSMIMAAASKGKLGG